MSRISRYATATTLAGIAGLHIAWGRGSSFPFATTDELTDAVVGSPAVPSPAACNAVAALLFGASALVVDVPIAPRWMRWTGRRVVVGVLTTRAIAGFSGHTDVLVPGSVSPRFRALDRRAFAPLCLALALGTATSQPRRLS